MEYIIGFILFILFLQYVIVLGGSYTINYIKSYIVTDAVKRHSIYQKK